MLTRLRLERFKNFKDAELRLGPFTVLMGTNASGKSNVRDAFRFLHGIARGYTLADPIGEKWGEGGVLQWRGIRGGSVEAAYQGAATFALTADFESTNGQGNLIPASATYAIEVEPGRNGKPRTVHESLYADTTMLFDSHPRSDPLSQGDPQHLTVRVLPGGQYRRGHVETFIASQPVLSQIGERIAHRKDERAAEVRQWVRTALASFNSMRFLDLNLDAMRLPSLPGQTILGDRGENLSSVLQAIYEDENRRQALIGWIQELTPMDVVDFAFPPDQTGRVLVSLIEENERKTSAYSASDGTLRFLAVLAALLGPEPAHLYFFEELENGLHPARLHLLVDLIEQRVAKRDLQVIATTHSPQLLRLLSPENRQVAALVYRLAGHPDARILRIGSLPEEARRVIEQKDVGQLLTAGWFENIMSFMADEEV
ncbi:MAG: AAA family ATPase [Anaerolineae bacterium]